jgi:NAD(P)-dependent dehydrogenase (short-subunit alcohol dehydrogenase family)
MFFMNPVSGHGLSFLLVTMPVSLYFVLSEACSRQATWGKCKVGLRVIRSDGTGMGVSRSLGRTALKFVAWELAHFLIWQVRFAGASADPLITAGFVFVWVRSGANLVTFRIHMIATEVEIMMNMLLQKKVAVVYGGGAIGSAVACAFAREGAQVYLADDNESSLEPVVQEITKNGHNITKARVDVLDPNSVEAFVESVVNKSGRLDISFCATSTHVPGGKQGSAFSELSYEDFSLPITDYTKSQFITANAASRHMIRQESGVIMMITAVPSRIPYPFTAGFGPAWAAVESMSRVLAAELGPYGIRTVCLHSAGSPEAAKSIEKTLTKNPELVKRSDGWNQRSASRNLLNKWPTLEDVGNMAAFFASDKAGVTTGATINLTGGMVND